MPQDLDIDQAIASLSSAQQNTNSGHAPTEGLNVEEAIAALQQNGAPASLASNPNTERQPLGIALDKNIGAILGSAGRNIANAPHNLFDFVSRATEPAFNAVGMQRAANPLPQMHPDYDYYQANGVEKTLPKELTQGLLEFSAPLGAARLATKAPFLAQDAAAGFLSGASQKDASSVDPIFGTAASVLGHGVGAGLNQGVQMGSKFYAKSALPGFIDKVGDMVKNNVIAPEEALSIFRNAFNSAKGESNNAWASAKNLASEIDAGIRPINPLEGEYGGFKKWSTPYYDDRLIRSQSRFTPLKEVMDPFTGQKKIVRETELARQNDVPAKYTETPAQTEKNPFSPEGDKLIQYGTPVNKTSYTQSNSYTDVPDLVKTIQYKSGNKLSNDDFNTKIDGSSYTKFIKNFISKDSRATKAESKNSPETIKFAESLIEKQPRNLEGLVNLRRTINDEYKRFIDKNNIKQKDQNAINFIDSLREKLKEIPGENRHIIGDEKLNLFNKAWEEANKSTQKLKEFQLSSNRAGDFVQNKILRDAAKTGTYSEPGILKEFEPKGRDMGISGQEQLEKLLKSKRDAQDVLRGSLFGNLDENVGKTVLKKYSKQSKGQRSALFGGKEEEPYLDAANAVFSRYGMPKEQSPFLLHHGGRAIGGSLLGYGLNKMGLPWEVAYPIGFGSAYGLKNALGYAASPASVKKAMELSSKELPNRGAYTQPLFAAALQGVSK